MLTPQFTYRHHADAGNQSYYATQQSNRSGRYITAFFHIDVRLLGTRRLVFHMSKLVNTFMETHHAFIRR